MLLTLLKILLSIMESWSSYFSFLIALPILKPSFLNNSHKKAQPQFINSAGKAMRAEIQNTKNASKTGPNATEKNHGSEQPLIIIRTTSTCVHRGGIFLLYHWNRNYWVWPEKSLGGVSGQSPTSWAPPRTPRCALFHLNSVWLYFLAILRNQSMLDMT